MAKGKKVGDKKPGSVSLKGVTRLTYAEAVALLEAVNRGVIELEVSEDECQERASVVCYRAISKLKMAILLAGGYDDNGDLVDDPFEEPK